MNCLASATTTVTVKVTVAVTVTVTGCTVLQCSVTLLVRCLVYATGLSIGFSTISKEVLRDLRGEQYVAPQVTSLRKQ